MTHSFLRGIGRVAGLACLTVTAASPAWAAEKPGSRMIDARVNAHATYEHALAARSVEVGSGYTKAKGQASRGVNALTALRARMPAAEVRFSNLTGAPTAVSNRAGVLTAPSNHSDEQIARDYLSANMPLFGLTASDLDDLVAVGDSTGSGLRMLRVEQRIDGRVIFQSETRFLVNAEGSLVKVVGQLVPSARSSVAAFDQASLLSPGAAVSRLMASDGHAVDAGAFAVSGTDADGRITLSETDDLIAAPITARPALFPLAPGVLVPAWSLVVFTAGEADWYAMVDAQTGDLLWRKNLREYASAQDARFRVYVQADGVTPADSPAPQSPTSAVPGAGTQFPGIAPTIVSMHTAYDATTSPNGWIDDCPGGGCTANETQTLGNNSVACVDQTIGANANICDTAAATVLDGNGRPTGNPDANARNRDFLGTTPRDFQTNYLPAPQGGNPEAGQTSTGNGNNGTLAIDQYRRGAVTNLFYVVNWYHDQLYKLGFDEAAGNFQQTNFSGMGLGNDRVAADYADGSGVDNANFSTPPDGSAGRMQMYRFTGPTIDRDGSLDSEIMMHELTHGTSNRLVGNGAGLNWDPARGMGEGWSDFVALSLLNNTNADNPNGEYASGAWATYKLAGLAYTDNYVYGIRRFPYSSDITVNPFTWADVDDVTNDLSGGIAPTTVTFNLNGAMEVHNSGEVWAETLWDVRARVIGDPAGANGDVPTGNHTMLQAVIDGMKLTPINPTFTDARDAIIEADCATNACANEASIWGGFAHRGLGYGAEAPYAIIGRYASSHESIHESFDSPKLDVVNLATDVTIDDSAANNNGTIDPGEPVKLTVKLTNPWRGAGKAVTSATAVLSTSTPGITIYDNTATYGAIAPQGTATGDTFLVAVDPSVTCGTAIDFTLTTTSNLGTTSTPISLRLGSANGTDPAITYTGDPNPDLTVSNNRKRGVFNQINITDDFVIADLNFRVDSITTPGAGDLTVMLRSPQGLGADVIALIDGLNDIGGTAISNMVIDDDVTNDAAHDMVQATTANAPYTASWQPVFNAPWAALVDPSRPADTVPMLSRYNGGRTKGTWSALVADVFNAAAGGTDGDGSFNGWSMIVTPVHYDCANFAAAAAVTATKVVSGTYRVGNTIHYDITLTNNGTANQADNAGAEFTDVVPASLQVVVATATSGTASNAGNTVTWNGSLAPLGGSVTITVIANILPAARNTTVSNQGTVSYDSNNDGSNDATALTDDPATQAANDHTSFDVHAAVITGTKTVSGTFGAGGTVTYTVVLSNSGLANQADNAGNEFLDGLPSGVTLVSATATSGSATTAGNIVSWNGAIAAGASVTITITATVNAGTLGSTISNQASFVYDSDDDGLNDQGGITDDPSVGGATDPTDFVLGGATESLSKTVTGNFVVGGTVTYALVLSNSGAVASVDNAGNEITDVLPADLTLISASSSSGTTATFGNTVFWNGGVAAGGTVAVTVNATINAGTLGHTVSNQASFAYDADGNGSNESTGLSDSPKVGGVADPTTFVVGGAVLDASKSVSGNFHEGGNVTYTIALRNTGPTASPDNPGNELTDVLPADLTLISASGTSFGFATANTATNTVTYSGSVPANATDTITVQASIKSGTMGHTVSNQATFVYDGDLNGSNESSGVSDDPATQIAGDATSFVVQGAAVTGTKTVSGSFVEGGAISYTIVLSNSGPSVSPDNVGDELLDVLPPPPYLENVVVSASSGTATFDTATHIAKWNGSVPGNGSVTITIDATIGAGTRGVQIQNQAGFSFDADGNGSNESQGLTDDPSQPGASDITSFTVGGADIALSKTVSGSFTVGSAVTYTLVRSNSGPTASADNPGDEVTDVLPASLALVSATASSGTAVAALGTNTLTWNGATPGNGSVTITIVATVLPSAGGTTVANQAGFAYDADGNGSNETSGVSDDPGTPATADATAFAVPVAQAFPPQPVPTLSLPAMLMLGLGVFFGAGWRLRRRAVK